MGAVPVHAQCLIAVVTQDPESQREPLLPEPFPPPFLDRLPVLSTAPIDVVQSQKLQQGLLTTRATWWVPAVVDEDLDPECPVASIVVIPVAEPTAGCSLAGVLSQSAEEAFVPFLLTGAAPLRH